MRGEAKAEIASSAPFQQSFDLDEHVKRLAQKKREDYEGPPLSYLTVV